MQCPDVIVCVPNQTNEFFSLNLAIPTKTDSLRFAMRLFRFGQVDQMRGFPQYLLFLEKEALKLFARVKLPMMQGKLTPSTYVKVNTFSASPK